MSQPSTRQELYERIRKSSRDAYILEEMIRLGFWPAGGTMPNDPADEIRKRTELEQKLRSLRSELARLQNEDAIRKELRKRRMEESRARQKETKERRLREKAERAAKWKERKKSEILYLGRGVSAGLGSDEGNANRLGGLPVLNTVQDLAGALGIDVGELRFLSFSRRTSQTNHYVRFTLPKKTGGERLISAPMPRLKRVQKWILENILAPVETTEAAHGFRAGRSIVTNAGFHVGSPLVVNIDLKDFFPTITYKRIKGLFRAMGYGERIATVLGLLCSEPEVQLLEVEGRRWYVAAGDRHLPQGAPTSPAITNLICRRLDRRMLGACKKLGFAYTRYADDLTFSSPKADAPAGELLGRVRHIVETEGFAIHHKKTRILRKGRRLEVTGLVVNEKIAVPRSTLRKFRALLFQVGKDGPSGKRWGTSHNLFASMAGFANFVHMVDPEKGRALRDQVERLRLQYS